MTRLEYVVDALQDLTKISLNQIYISYASHRDSFPLARTISDAQARFRMQHEQRVIVKFLFNNGLDPGQLVEKLEAQFHEDAYSFRAVSFGLVKCDEIEKTFMMSRSLETRRKSISQPKSKNY
jgi:hypothetical protein